MQDYDKLYFKRTDLKKDPISLPPQRKQDTVAN